METQQKIKPKFQIDDQVKLKFGDGRVYIVHGVLKKISLHRFFYYIVPISGDFFDSKDEAVKCLAELFFGGDVKSEDMQNIIEDGVEELSEEDMNTIKHLGEDGCQGDPYPRTFREELDDLIEKNTEFPCHFAASEW